MSLQRVYIGIFLLFGLILLLVLPSVSAQDRYLDLVYGSQYATYLERSSANHYWRLNAQAGDTVRINVTGYEGMQPFVTIISPGGQTLGFYGASNGVVDVTNFVFGTTGTHSIRVSASYNGFGSGRYTIAIEKIGTTPINNAPTAIPTFYSGSGSLITAPPAGSRFLGGLDIAAYCQDKGYTVSLINNQRDWACTRSSGDVVFILTQSDFNLSCKTWYNTPWAFAVQSGTNQIAAYNWACYDFGVGAIVTRTPSAPTAQAGSNIVGGYDLNRPIGTLSPRENVEVNVRSGPGTGYSILGKIDWRQSFPLLGREGDWYVINYNGRLGYVAVRWTQVR